MSASISRLFSSRAPFFTVCLGVGRSRFQVAIRMQGRMDVSLRAGKQAVLSTDTDCTTTQLKYKAEPIAV